MKQNLYTAQDIERYHRSELPAAEMHALEKAALDDPMLADALEGFTHTTTLSTDVSALQQKLRARIAEKKDEKKIFFIGNKLMKIAALFVVFAGAGWLVFQTLSNKNTEVAVEPQAKKQNTLVLPQTGVDSSMVYSDAPASNSIVAEKEEARKDSIQGNGRLSNTITYKQYRIPPTTFSAPVTTDSANNTSADVVMMSRQRNRAFDSNYDKATTFAEVEKQSAAKDLSGKVPGVQTDTIKNLNIVLQPADVTMNEVVVKKRDEKSPGTESKMKLKLTADTLKNTDDWDDYIASNMRKPEEVNSVRKTGEVELSFTTNQRGEAINITVTKSLCDKCDEEAIRLLKDGPKWKKNKKGKVKVKF